MAKERELLGKTGRRRWLVSAIKVVGISLVVGVGALALGADWMRERSQLFRALTWMDADVGDIDRFPTRSIATGSDVDPLRPGTGYEFLFDTVQLVADGDTLARDFDEFLESQDTWAFLLLRGDSVIHERYFGGKSAETLFTTFSASKSVLSAAVGAAIDRGLIDGIDDPVTEYVPELLERDPRFADITVGHLMSMASGLAYEDGPTPWSDGAVTYYAPHLRAAALKARVTDRPGERFLYNNYNPLLVGLALERATGRTLSEFISETIWKPLGTEADASWSLDSRRSGFEKMESGFNARARDLARFGRLFLRAGRGPVGPVLSEAWVSASTAADSVSDPSLDYQSFWWVHPVQEGPAEFYAEGRFGQFVYVVPDLDMVIVRLGKGDGTISWRRFLAGMAEELRESVAASPGA